MKRKVFGTILLSLALASTNCIYAEETIIPSETQIEEVQTENVTDVPDIIEIPEVNGSEALGDDVNQNQGMNGEQDENIFIDNQGEIGEGMVLLTLNSKIALVDGKEVELLTAPKVVNNTTLLPLRFVGEEVAGAAVSWDQETRTATLYKDGIEVVVVIGSKIAKVDGLECELTTEPIVENGTTLLPLRFISEAFNIKVEYNSETKEIKIDKGSQEEIPMTPNQAPIASFYFPETYIAGQQVSVVNTSTDPDGDQITEQLWSVLSGDKQVTNKELSNMFKTPKAGTYIIGLQVKDDKGYV